MNKIYYRENHFFKSLTKFRNLYSEIETIYLSIYGPDRSMELPEGGKKIATTMTKMNISSKNCQVPPKYHKIIEIMKWHYPTCIIA